MRMLTAAPAAVDENAAVLPGRRAAAAILPLGTEWAIESRYAAAALEQVNGMELTPELVAAGFARSRSGGGDDERPYALENGVATISIEGPLTKKPTCMSYFFGGTSTLETRAVLRQAAKDSSVREIVLCIDSPGGQVAGTFDLADEVKRVGASKRVTAYVEDLCASAAYAIASQASRIVANRTAMVGSIGTYMVLVDSSGAAKSAGYAVHVIRSGEFKGAGTPGTELSNKQKAEFGRTIADLNQQFLQTVAAGRGLTIDAVEELADGRVWIGADAVACGLIDAVGSLDDVMAEISARQYSRPMARTGKGDTSMTLKGAWDAFRAGFTAAGGDEEADKPKESATPASGNPATEEEPAAPGIAVVLDEAAPVAGLNFEAADALQKRLAELESAKAALEAAKVTADAQKATAEAARIDGVLAGLKRDGLLTPAAEGAARKLIASDEAAFSAFVADQGRLVAFTKPEDKPRTEPANGAAVAAELGGGESAFAQLSRIAAEAMAKEKLPYVAAFNRACSERPELAAQHLEESRAK